MADLVCANRSAKCSGIVRWWCDDGKVRCGAHFHFDRDGLARPDKVGTGNCCKLRAGG